MLDAVREACYFVRGKSRQELDGDRQLSLIHCIENIGEAASCIDPDFREAQPETPWIDIIGMRIRLNHAYCDLGLGLVWSTSKDDLPELI